MPDVPAGRDCRLLAPVASAVPAIRRDLLLLMASVMALYGLGPAGRNALMALMAHRCHTRAVTATKQRRQQRAAQADERAGAAFTEGPSNPVEFAAPWHVYLYNPAFVMDLVLLYFQLHLYVHYFLCFHPH